MGWGRCFFLGGGLPGESLAAVPREMSPPWSPVLLVPSTSRGCSRSWALPQPGHQRRHRLSSWPRGDFCPLGVSSGGWGRTQGLGGSVRGCAARPYLGPCWDTATPCLAVAMQKVMFFPQNLSCTRCAPFSPAGHGPPGSGSPKFCLPGPVAQRCPLVSGEQLVKRQESGSCVS